MRWPAALLVLLVFAAPSCAEQLPIKRSLSETPWGWQKVQEPVRAGETAQRFELRAGDCGETRHWSDCATDRERTEISVQKPWQYGTPMWIGFSVYVPENFETSGKVRTTAGQIHQRGGPKKQSGQRRSLPPVMQLELQGNRYFARVHVLSGPKENVKTRTKALPLTSVSAMRGRWTDIEIGFLTSHEGGEQLLVYVNGELQAEMQDFIVYLPKEYYFKYGVYRSFKSRHGGPMPTQVLLYDELRMGPSRAAVHVNPSQPVD